MKKYQLSKIFGITLVFIFAMHFSFTIFAHYTDDDGSEPEPVDNTLKIASSVTTVDGSAEGGADVGKFSSLDIDSQNHLHIAYYDNTNHDLKYATNASGSWVSTTVDSSGDVGTYSSLKIDSSNKAHIAYYDATNLDLKYATNSTDIWVTSVVDNSGDDVGIGCSLALDPSGSPRISYDEEDLDGEQSYLKYAAKSGGSWSTSRVTSASSSTIYSSITMDSGGTPHISYNFYVSGSMHLRYAHKDGGSWSVENADSCVESNGSYSSILIDSSGNPGISYYDASGKNPSFSHKVDGAWNCMRFDTADSDGLYNSLALDSTDHVYITHYDSTNGMLQFITNRDDTWNIATLDSGSDTGLYTSLVLDDSGTFHASYYDATNHALKYITFFIDKRLTWYIDSDNDGFGNANSSSLSETQPSGYVADSSDCDDSDNTVYPAASELCDDQKDNNCDSNINEGCSGDASLDGDGDGYSYDDGDCRDNNASIHPTANEVCDGVDNNCNNEIDEAENCLTPVETQVVTDETDTTTFPDSTGNEIDNSLGACSLLVDKTNCLPKHPQLFLFILTALTTLVTARLLSNHSEGV